VAGMGKRRAPFGFLFMSGDASKGYRSFLLERKCLQGEYEAFRR
jgi:hypothetical protein